MSNIIYFSEYYSVSILINITKWLISVSYNYFIAKTVMLHDRHCLQQQLSLRAKIQLYLPRRNRYLFPSATFSHQSAGTAIFATPLILWKSLTTPSQSLKRVNSRPKEIILMSMTIQASVLPTTPLTASHWGRVNILYKFSIGTRPNHQAKILPVVFGTKSEDAMNRN